MRLRQHSASPSLRSAEKRTDCECNVLHCRWLIVLITKERRMPEYHLRMRELPPSEQPRERLRDHGAAALSDSELLAILLRVGVAGTNVGVLAQQLLVEHGGWPGLLRADYHDLCKRHGIGEAKAATLKAALEIGRRLLL